MFPKRNYYLNDYFDIFNPPYPKEREYMKTDIYEHNNKYHLVIDLPGIKKENIKILYDNGYLTITANNNILASAPEAYLRRERLFGEVKRSFYIGIKKENELIAKYKDGILTISFPKEDIQNTPNKNITIT